MLARRNNRRYVPKPEAGEIDTNCIGSKERAANAAFKT
jgi:hypothetical protein